MKLNYLFFVLSINHVLILGALPTNEMSVPELTFPLAPECWKNFNKLSIYVLDRNNF